MPYLQILDSPETNFPGKKRSSLFRRTVSDDEKKVVTSPVRRNLTYSCRGSRNCPIDQGHIL
jgi:hypothetical protein